MYHLNLQLRILRSQPTDSRPHIQIAVNSRGDPNNSLVQQRYYSQMQPSVYRINLNFRFLFAILEKTRIRTSINHNIVN